MTRTAPVAAIAAALALALAACAAPSDTASTPAEAGFPRTVQVPAGPAAEATELVIPAEPRRIAALSYETAELVAALGLADRLVVVLEAVRNPALTNHLEQMAAVPHTIPTESETDPEEIIGLDPDLVLLSARHGLDTGAGRVLAAAGIPVLLLPNTWTGPDDLALNVRIVGEATGADRAAEGLADDILAGLAPQADADDGPRILVLSNQAGRPFITAGTAFPLHLLELAGGQDVSAELGIQATGPITAEQLVQADPDGILLIDMNGSGQRLFAELLGNPAVAGLAAVAEDRIALVEGRQVQALGIGETVEGLAVLREWIAGMPAPASAG